MRVDDVMRTHFGTFVRPSEEMASGGLGRPRGGLAEPGLAVRALLGRRGRWLQCVASGVDAGTAT